MLDMARVHEAFEASTDFTVGIEEEVMLLDPRDWSLASRIDDVLPALSGGR